MSVVKSGGSAAGQERCFHLSSVHLWGRNQLLDAKCIQDEKRGDLRLASSSLLLLNATRTRAGQEETQKSSGLARAALIGSMLICDLKHVVNRAEYLAENLV